MKNLLFLTVLIWLPFTISAQQSVDFSKFRGEKTIQFKTTSYLQNTAFCEYNVKHRQQPLKTGTLPPEISSPKDTLNYFLITEKLAFDYRGSSLAFYKYFKVKNGVKSEPFSIQVEKQGGNWAVVSHQELKPLEYLIRHLKYKILYKFLEKGTSGDEAIDAIAKRCLSVDGTLNYEKLYEALKNEMDKKTPLAERLMDF